MVAILILVSCFTMHFNHESQDCYAFGKYHRLRAVRFAQYACLAMPMVVFQASSVKNDLCLSFYFLSALLALALLANADQSKPSLALRVLWPICAISILIMIGSKGYSLLALPGIFLFALYLRGSSSATFGVRNSKANALARLDYWAGVGFWKRISLYAFVLLLASILLSFLLISKSFVAESWGGNVYEEAARHLTPLATGVFPSRELVVNPLRLLVEAAFQWPLLFHLDLTSALGGFFSSDRIPYPFAFGSYFGEDIAWPSPLFWLVGVAVAISSVFAYLRKPCPQSRLSICRLSLASALALAGALNLLAMSIVIFWQPWYSRFLAIGVLPLIPFVARRLAGLDLKGFLRILGLLILVPSAIALLKSVAQVFAFEFFDRDHYHLKAHGMSEARLRDTVLTDLEKDSKFQYCPDHPNSPSLYSLMKIRQVSNTLHKKIIFTDADVCSLSNDESSSSLKAFRLLPVPSSLEVP